MLVGTVALAIALVCSSAYSLILYKYGARQTQGAAPNVSWSRYTNSPRHFSFAYPEQFFYPLVDDSSSSTSIILMPTDRPGAEFTTKLNMMVSVVPAEQVKGYTNIVINGHDVFVERISYAVDGQCVDKKSLIFRSRRGLLEWDIYKYGSNPNAVCGQLLTPDELALSARIFNTLTFQN